MTESSKILTLTEVADLSRRALAGCGARGQQLDLAVDSIVEAECDGIRTVGLGYLPLYCGHLQVGKINRDAQPAHALIAPSALRSMADSGFAHAAFAEAEQAFYALAGQQGIAAARVPDQEEIGPPPDVRIALDLDANSEELNHRPEERRSPPGLEPEVEVRPSLVVHRSDVLPNPESAAREDAYDLAGQVDRHQGGAPERNAVTAAKQVDEDRDR